MTQPRDETVPKEIELIAQHLKEAKEKGKPILCFSGSALNTSCGLPDMEVPSDAPPFYSSSSKPLSLLREQACPTAAYMAISELFKNRLWLLSVALLLLGVIVRLLFFCAWCVNRFYHGCDYDDG
jgi:hypothetical protein